MVWNMLWVLEFVHSKFGLCYAASLCHFSGTWNFSCVLQQINVTVGFDDFDSQYHYQLCSDYCDTWY